MKLIFLPMFAPLPSSWKKPHIHQWPNKHRGQPQSFQENKGRPRITSLQIENSGQVTQRKRLILNGCKKNHIVEITWSFAGAHQWAPVICHCYTSQLKSVFWLEENVSRAVGQNSLSLCGEQNSLGKQQHEHSTRTWSGRTPWNRGKFYFIEPAGAWK